MVVQLKLLTPPFSCTTFPSPTYKEPPKDSSFSNQVDFYRVHSPLLNRTTTLIEGTSIGKNIDRFVKENPHVFNAQELALALDTWDFLNQGHTIPENTLQTFTLSNDTSISLITVIRGSEQRFYIHPFQNSRTVELSSSAIGFTDKAFESVQFFKKRFYFEQCIRTNPSLSYDEDFTTDTQVTHALAIWDFLHKCTTDPEPSPKVFTPSEPSFYPVRLLGDTIENFMYVHYNTRPIEDSFNDVNFTQKAFEYAQIFRHPELHKKTGSMAFIVSHLSCPTLPNLHLTLYETQSNKKPDGFFAEKIAHYRAKVVSTVEQNIQAFINDKDPKGLPNPRHFAHALNLLEVFKDCPQVQEGVFYTFYDKNEGFYPITILKESSNKIIIYIHLTDSHIIKFSYDEVSFDDRKFPSILEPRSSYNAPYHPFDDLTDYLPTEFPS